MVHPLRVGTILAASMDTLMTMHSLTHTLCQRTVHTVTAVSKVVGDFITDCILSPSSIHKNNCTQLGEVFATKQK